MFRWPTATVLSAVVAIAALSVPADAQFNPFRRSAFELSEAEIQLAQAAAAKLYEGEKAELGDVERWADPSRGTEGTVTLIRIFTHNDMPCRRLQHDIRPGRAGESTRLIFDRCKAPSGEWKFLQAL